MEIKTSNNNNSTKEFSIIELESKIRNKEAELQNLRKLYIQKTGQTPTRPLNDSTWKWTVFMVLGFAYISCMVFLLGIRKSGRQFDNGIPPFFYATDFAYFALLTFFVILTVLAVQSDRIVGYQAWALIFGFWCAHWLIYDWAWHAINIGMGLNDMSTFWTMEFYAPLLIPHPPMWLFLTLALLGGVMSLYTFTIPDCNRKLFPAALWLFTVYGNATICEMIGLDRGQILVVGIILASIAFGVAGLFTYQRLKKGLPDWLPTFSVLKDKMKKENWSIDPLGAPMIFIIIGMLVLMHLFLVLIPVVGLFFGMLPWFFIPGWFLFVKSSGYEKASKAKKAIIGIFYAGFLVLLVIFMSLY